MEYIEKTLKKNYIYKGRVITLRKDEALLPDGKPCIREIIEHSGGACALYVENEQILFVKQYRYAYGESVLEIPAGKLEKGEDPLLAAKRELEEEAGIQAERLEYIATLYPTPGYTNEKIYVYRAFDGKRVRAHLDEDEFVDVVWLPISTVKNMLKNGEIHDAKTLVALQSYFLSI